jgi:hypothetical protein
MLFCHNVCLQIGDHYARSPTNNTSCVLNGNVFVIDIAYFKHYSIAQTMLLIIVDISSIMMTFAIFSFSMILLGSRKIDKYLRTRMRNAMCIVVVVEHKRNVDVPIGVDNNTFLSSIRKCCVMYFTKKKFPVPCVHV